MSEEPNRGAGCAALAAVFICGAIIGGFVGFFAGGIAAGTRHFHDQFLSRQSAIEPALRADPEFKALRIEECSTGELHLHGPVPTDASKKRLLETLTRGVGETDAREMAGMVEPSPSK
jgi:hypothetical protein